MKRTTFLIAFILALLSSFELYSQTTYYSNATATDFNNVASWGTATDGTGTAPASISNADNFIIANNAALTLSANATVRQLTINSGSLSVASNTLTVGIQSQKKSSLVVSGGTLNVSGGAVNVDGYLSFTSGYFNQSGGAITIDPNNNGDTATSTTSSQYTLNITSSNGVNWTGGTLTVLDPPASTSTSHYSLYYNSSVSSEVSTSHTLKFGDGTSADAGGHANGFYIYNYVGSGKINFGNFDVYGPSATNRKVTLYNYSNGIKGLLNIYNGGELDQNSITLYIGGNVNVASGGTWTASSIAYFAMPQGTSFVTNTNSQSVTINGIVRNASTSPSANFSSLTVNNSSTGGVVISGTNNIATQPANSASVSGTLAFITGKLSTSGNASVILGTASPSAGTLSYTAGGFASGTTFGRWFTAAGTGSSFTAGSNATTATSRYPFVNASGQDRSAWIERVSPTAAAGILGIVYTNTTGTTAVNATDASVTPSFAVDTKGNDGWQVSNLSGTPLAATSFKLQIQAPGMFGAQLANANTRIIQGSAFVGVHQAGTVTPGGQRITLTGTELTAAPFSLAISSSDLPFMSVASGDWNNPATWATGVVPTCNDVVNILAGHIVTVNSAGNVSKGLIINVGGTLTVASGDLTVGCTLNNATLTNNGTLNITGGTLTLNGNFDMNNGANLSQSGGNFNIDGNDNGATATSVASGLPIFRIGNSTTSYSTGTINLTGGTITIVDPHTASSASNGYAVYVYFPSGFNVEAGAGHTFRLGDGVSTQAGGHTSGFYVDTWVSSGRLNPGNVIVNNPTGTNRNVVTPFAFAVHGNVTVAAGDFKPASLILRGNLAVTGGTYTATGGLTLAIPSGTSTVVNTAAQTLGFTAPGVIKNAATAETANFTSVTVNNSSTDGVTLNNPFSLSGTLTLTAGKVNTTAANLLTVGTATAAGSISGGGAAAYVNGPLARTIATANAATNYIQFPVGKAAYAPVWIAPTTTAVSVFKAEAFDTNTGTMDPSIMNLAAGRRWEVPLVSGTYTDIKVRLGGTALVTGNIPVTAPTAAGAYSSTFGSVATFATGTPNTIQSNNAVTAANYTGFISYAESNLCSGTPAPGNTVASANSICAGQQVTLSAQNNTTGSGVTYQWQSSADGTTYANIDGATSATYTTNPTAAAYYRLNVTCSAGPATGTSTPVQVTFANSITGTTPATRCGTGTVALQATASAGATPRWYAAATGGAPVGEGASFTTPSLSSTTTYYVSAETGGSTLAGGKLAPESGWDGYVTSNWGIVFNALQDVNVNSVDVYSTTAGTLKVKITNAAGTELFASATINVAGGTTTVTTVPLGFTVPAGTGYKILVKEYSGVNLVRGSTNIAFPYTNANISVVGSEWGGTTTGTYYFFYNIVTSSGCGSARVPVTATVNPAPALTLSGNPAAVCSGASTTAVTLTAGASDYDTFTWTPATGVSGSAAAGWTFNPSVSTTYTLNASSSTGAMCVANAATVNVTVNALPTALTVNNSAGAAACPDQVQTLTVNGGTSLVTGTVGNGTTVTGTIEELTAFCNRRDTYKSQTIYTAADLIAAGVEPGTLVSIAYNITSVGSAANVTDYTVKIGTTALSAFANTTYLSETGFTTVFGPATYNHAIGLNTVTFTTPFVWDGTSNIVICVSHGGADSIYNAQTYYTDLGANTTLYNYNDLAATTGTASVKRFNVTFNVNAQDDITWSPATNLYTNAAATTPYVAGAIASTVYFKSATAGTTAYTATATTTAGCSVSGSVNATVNVTAAPVASAQTFCGATNVSQLQATGTAIQWYAAATGGTALAGTASVSTGTYYASQTLNGCESTTRTAVAVTVNVTAEPTASAQTFCNAATVANLVATGTGIQWYAAATGGTALAGTTALATGTYYVSQTLNSCESARVAVSVTVNVTAAPTASAQAFCNAATVANLVATGTGIQWYAAATGGTALTADVALATGTYYASQTLNGCESATRTSVAVMVNVTAAPTASAQTFCNTATVTNLVATGSGIQWYAAATGGTALAADAALATGTYYASQTIDGCESITRTSVAVTVNVTAAPAASAQTFCNAATVANLVATGSGLQWYAAATGGTPLNFDAALATGTYYVSQTIDNCESATRTAVAVTINVTAEPTASAQTFCNAATVADLEATGTGIQWYADATGGTALAADAALATGTYYASQTIDGCESATRATVAVTVNVTPGVQGAATQEITVDQAGDATIEDIVVTAAGTVTWYASLEDAQTGTDALAAGTVLLTNTTYYAVQTIDGCTSSEVLAVTITVTLGREDFNTSAFGYYPNPVKDVITVTYNKEITAVTVVNLLGQQVISVNPNATEAKIDMSGLAEGSYILTVQSGNAVKTVKVIKAGR